MAEDYNGTPLPENQNSESGNEGENENIPDWMKDAGWETSSGTFDESKPIFDDLDDDEDLIVPADIPSWLEDAAPEGFSSDPNATPAFEGLDVDEPFITTGDLVPPPSMQPPAEEPELEQTQEAEKPTETDGFDIPSWLDNLELDEDSQETAVAWLENMPESLRATEEEIQAAKEVPAEEPEDIEDPVDELGWVDDIAFDTDRPSISDEEAQAALSEDLVASELIPETGDPDQIFEQEEIESMESALPSWLTELGDDQPDTPAADQFQKIPSGEKPETPSKSQEETLPDWLRSPEDMEETPETRPPSASEPAAPAREEESDIPAWLSDFEDSASDTSDAEEGLEWLESLEKEGAAPETIEPPPGAEITRESQVDEPTVSETVPEQSLQSEEALAAGEITDEEDISPYDETLNTQVPEWLSQIGDTGEVEEQDSPSAQLSDALADSDQPSAEDDFDTSDSWLDQIGEVPPDTTRESVTQQEDQVVEWLDEMQEIEETPPAEDTADLRESIIDQKIDEVPYTELESAKFFTEEESDSDELPDWLSELREDEEEQDLTLEEAIRQSDHDLNEAEVDFLSKIDEKQEDEADWLSKLDQVETEPDLMPPSPQIEFDQTEKKEPSEEKPEEPLVAGGMLERLKETGELKTEDEIPQWLEDVKEEEDPQETAVLWLQQFVKQGDSVDIKSEIKRYTDELDPGDNIPKWMEDLKNEEDPQTTAMLWLEKLAADRVTQTTAQPPEPAEEDSGWLADLEREAAEDTQGEQDQEIREFDDPDQGWLSDLDIDEKLKTPQEEIPDWSAPEEDLPEGEPPWMKATSPLEGDFYTDELEGGEEKEVEIPDWLAGYAEGERPEEIEEAETEEEEYTWLSAKEAPAAPSGPLDLNQAAISQLEAILGISHQIAWGIVTYREKHGPFQDFSDLNNVPEITDEQTIDILKPEVFISPVTEDEKEPSPEPAPKKETAPPKKKTEKKPAKTENFEEMLVTARARLKDNVINEATELYASLIKKKKFLDEVIEDLQKASLDHPLEISIQKTLGDAFMKKDLLDEALEAYSKAEDLLR